MVSAARDFERFNEVAQFVQIVKASPHDVYRYSVIGQDGKVCARGNLPAFVLDRAAWWEQHYAEQILPYDLDLGGGNVAHMRPDLYETDRL